jgi:5-methylcytosine-specific restriction endonuclease McrA
VILYLCQHCHGRQPKPGLCPDCKRADNQRRNRKTAELGRSTSAWRTFRRANIKRRCERCGTDEHLTYHYVPTGRHSFNPDDYQTLCRSCHGKQDAPRAHYANH